MVNKKPKPSLKVLVKSESGLMTWGTIFSVLVLMVMLSLVFNSTKTVAQKVETQNTADAVAYSSATWMARGMNALTATNHIIGELNALYSLHHALGGKYLDNHASDKTPNNTEELERLNDGINARFTIRWKVGIGLFSETFSLSLGGYDALKSFTNPKPVDKATDMVSTNPVADKNSAIYECKRELKEKYRTALYLHFTGAFIEKVLQFVPYIGPVFRVAGKAIQYLALAAELKIWSEYLMLEGLEQIALATSKVKTTIPDVIAALHVYQKATVYVQAPVQAFRCAQPIAEQNYSDSEGFVRGDVPSEFPSLDPTSIIQAGSEFFPKMPVALEETSNEDRSQMIRATYPWVAYWRRFPIKLFQFQRFEIRLPWPLKKRLIFHSRFAEHYRKWTNVYSRQASEWLRKPKGQKYTEMLTVENYEIRGSWPTSNNGEVGKDVRLFVMLDLNEQADGSKSLETWNRPTRTGSYRADEIFCLIGFAKRPKHSLFSKPFFRQENPNGFLCYSQAMIYNANKQQEPTEWNGPGNRQAEVGWDTLNWSTDNKFGKTVEQGFEWQFTTQDRTLSSSPPGTSGWTAQGWNREHHEPPGIKLNWQAKLTPLTPQKMLKVLSTQTLGTLFTGDEETRRILMTNREAQLYLQNH